MGKEAHVKKNSTFKLGRRHKLILEKAVEKDDYDSMTDVVRTLIDNLEHEKGYLKEATV